LMRPGGASPERAAAALGRVCALAGRQAGDGLHRVPRSGGAATVLSNGLRATAPPGDRGAGEGLMTVSPVSARHWRSYGNDPLPTGQEALDEPFRAFPRPLRQDPDAQRGAHAAARPADSATSSPRCATTAVAAGRAGWSCSPDRGRVQPAGATDRCDGRLTSVKRNVTWGRPGDQNACTP
jgi:hypothetical protein